MNVQETIDSLKKRYGCPVWPTRDGDLVPVRMLEQRHLENAYNALARENVELRESADWERDAVVLCWMRILEEEMKRRKDN